MDSLMQRHFHTTPYAKRIKRCGKSVGAFVAIMSNTEGQIKGKDLATEHKILAGKES